MGLIAEARGAAQCRASGGDYRIPLLGLDEESF